MKAHLLKSRSILLGIFLFTSPLFASAQVGLPSNCLTIVMMDTFGDGWNNGSFSITDFTGEVVVTGTLAGGTYGEQNFCLYDGCYTIEVNGGTFPEEVYWTIQDVNEGFVEGLGNSTVQFSVGDIYPGCTDPNAINYTELFGIRLANCEDGSCCYSNVISIYMTDSYGDGWNGGALAFQNSAGTIVESVTLEDGLSGSGEICLPDGCYTVIAIGGTFPSEIGWTIINPYNYFQNYTGAAPGIYSIEIGSVSSGCTDPNANNYDPSATCFDGSCEYCDATMTLELFDSAGDGWEGATLSIYETNGTKLMDYTLSDGSYRIIQVCLPMTCSTYSLFVEGGDHPEEISYVLSHWNDGMVYYGNATAMLSVYADGAVFGCTDPAATNYNSAANCPGCNSCIYTSVESCVGDLNNDNFVNITDLLIFVGAFGSSCD